MRTSVVVASLVVLAVCAVGVARAAETEASTGNVVCELIVNCELCAAVQMERGVKTKPCFWDWESKSCHTMQGGDRCEGNKVNFGQECRQCKQKYEAKAAAKAKSANAAGAAGAAGGAGASAGGFKKGRCTLAGQKGICVANASACRDRPFGTNPACGTGVCCGMMVKAGKNAQTACGKHSNKCFNCVREKAGRGCAYHKGTGMCTSAAMAKGDAYVQDDRFCSGADTKRHEQRAKNKAKNKKKF